MIRLLPLVLFLLPIVLFAAWFLLALRKERLAASGRLPRWQRAPWTMILASTAVAAIVLLVTVALLPGNNAWAPYTPPRLEDGVVVPGHVGD